MFWRTEKKVVKDKCPHQTLDGRFGDGKSEAHGKYSAKEGVRPHQARPQTNIQVCFLLNDSNLKPNTFSRHLTESLVMERVRRMASTARRRGWDQTKQDLRPIYRCLLLRTFEMISFEMISSQCQLLVQPTGRAEGESETQDRQINHLWNQLGRFAPTKIQIKMDKTHCSHRTKHRFSAKEGATRPDQARPRTNIQVFYLYLPK